MCASFFCFRGICFVGDKHLTRRHKEVMHVWRIPELSRETILCLDGNEILPIVHLCCRPRPRQAEACVGHVSLRELSKRTDQVPSEVSHDLFVMNPIVADRFDHIVGSL